MEVKLSRGSVRWATLLLVGVVFAGCASDTADTAVGGVRSTLPATNPLATPGNGETSPSPEALDPNAEPDAADLANASLVGDWTATITFTKIVGPDAPPKPPKPLTRLFRFACTDGIDTAGCELELERETSVGISSPQPVTEKDGVLGSVLLLDAIELCEGIQARPRLSVNLKVTDAEVRDGVWIATAIEGTGTERIKSPNQRACPGFRSQQRIELVRV